MRGPLFYLIVVFLLLKTSYILPIQLAIDWLTSNSYVMTCSCSSKQGNAEYYSHLSNCVTFLNYVGVDTIKKF